jgi:hypothetical protein
MERLNMNEDQFMPVTSLGERLMQTEGAEDTPFFRILLTGNFDESHVRTKMSGHEVVFPEWIRRRTEVEWQKISGGNPTAFPGPLARLHGFGVEHGNLLLELDVTNYKDYKGGIALSTEERKEARYELANPLAVAVLTYSKSVFDGKGGILFAQRNLATDQRPGALEIPGGALHIEHLKSGVWSAEHPVTTGLRELREEQGVHPNELTRIRVAGLVYEDFEDAAPTLICLAEIDPSIAPADLTERATDAEARAVWLTTEDPRDLTNALLGTSASTTSVTLAAFYLFLKERYRSEHAGESDLSSYYLERLRKRGETYRNMPREKLRSLQERTSDRYLHKL